MNAAEDIFGSNIIFSYTRAQALSDGVLIDLSGSFPSDTRMFTFPLACTSAVWTLIESAASDEDVDPALYVWDVAYMAYNAVNQRKTTSDEVQFMVSLPLTENGTEHRLKLHLGPGDAGEPVLTIMLAHED